MAAIKRKALCGTTLKKLITINKQAVCIVKWRSLCRKMETHHLCQSTYWELIALITVNTPRMTTTKDDSVVVEATEIIRKKSQPSHQPTITASLNKLKPYSADSRKHKAITHAIGRFIAQDIQPLDVVNQWLRFQESYSCAGRTLVVSSSKHYCNISETSIPEHHCNIS